MAEQRAEYTAEARQQFDVSRAEMNLILRLRQHRGMIIIDADSMTLWAANKAEYCNGRKYAAPLPFELPPMG